MLLLPTVCCQPDRYDLPTAPATLHLPTCSGEAHQWLVRGKKRAGFELNIEFKWACQLEGAQVTGTAK